jgi:SAM-dependent methyltransferase
MDRIMRLFEEPEFAGGRSLADFGCSNGYLISLLRESVFPNNKFEFVGFDHSDALLSSARSRGIPNASFHRIDLNSPESLKDRWRERFDIVTCFETIEHTGSFSNAFRTLYRACGVGGVMLLSLPNEKGAPGLMKYVGRKIFRENPYGDFFGRRSEIDYVRHLLLNKPIDRFRIPPQSSWGPHLGFDWEVVARFINKSFIKTRRLEWRFKSASFLKFSLIFAFRKIG